LLTSEKKNNALLKRMEATEKLVSRCRNNNSHHLVESQAATIQNESTPSKAKFESKLETKTADY
jgi:hypothetical protein